MATPNANQNTFGDNLNNNFKVVYADKVKMLVPEDTKLLAAVPFDSSHKLGKRFEKMVSLSYGAGFTYAGTDDMLNLNAAQSGKNATASVDANEYLLREQISYKALSRSENDDQAAFIDATKLLVKGMNVAFSREMEAQLMYGGVGIATVASATGTVVTIPLAEWADGIWTGCEGSRLVQFYRAGTLLVSTGGTTVSSDGTLASRVTAVNTANQTITLDVVPTGLTAGDVIYMAGAFGRQMVGLHSICGNTGTLFGIAASQSALWRGNTVAVGGLLTAEKVLAGINPVIGKGLSGQDLTLYIGVRSFAAITKDIIDKRVIDSSYSTAKLSVGTNAVEIYGQNGVITVVPHTFVKEGYAYGIVPEDFSRIGSYDKSFTMPGEDGQFFHQVPNSAAWELRIYSDQALFCEQPGRQILFTGIDPTANS